MKRRFGNATIQAEYIYPIEISYNDNNKIRRYYVKIQTTRNIVGTHGIIEELRDEETIEINKNEYNNIAKEMFDLK